MLKVGDQIPDSIILQDQNGHPHKLADYVGKYIVVYFYPKDDTPGCTAEACSFRDFNSEIKKLGVQIIGISKDTVESHKKFEQKENLNFVLLADPDLILHNAFGVWGEKNMFGKTFMGTLRTTYIVDPNSRIIKIWKEVVPENHAEEVFNYLKNLLAN